MRRPLIALAIVALLSACSSGDDDGTPSTTTTEADTTSESTATTAAPTTERSTTTEATTTTAAPTTLAPPGPEAATSDLALCEYLTQVDEAQDEGTVYWVGVPTPPEEQAPLLVLGFSLDGSRDTDRQIELSQEAFVAAALPYLQQAMALRPALTSAVIVSTGNTYDLSNKTIFQFDRAAIEAIDDPAFEASRAETATWTQGGLPFTYLAPHPSRLDALGQAFVDGSACSGLT
jgi:hypothetical protein